MCGCLKLVAVLFVLMIVAAVVFQPENNAGAPSAMRSIAKRQSPRPTRTPVVARPAASIITADVRRPPADAPIQTATATNTSTASPVPPTATPEPAFTVRRISPPLTRETRDFVNLRSGPGTQYDKVGTVGSRTRLSIIGESGDWYLIRHAGREVFIASWLTFDLPTATPVIRRTATPRISVRRFSSPQRKYTHGDLNLRSGPGTSYRRVGAVGAGTSLQVLGQSGNWYLIKHNGRDAYVASWLVHNSPPTRQRQHTVQQPAQNQQPSYSCNCSKTCGQMSSCREAYFQLNNCGCRRRDGDNDGVPCESICS